MRNNKLILTIKKKWFDMIISGEKKEEYREIKPYYVPRFINFKQYVESDVLDEFTTDLKHPRERHSSVKELMTYFHAEFKEFKYVEFRNGYGKKVPSCIVPFEKITVDVGWKRLGAERKTYYFVIKLK